MLDRQPTKNIFTPNAFRKLSRCIGCGYCYERSGKLCKSCQGKHYKKCISCECYLKKENYFTYTYDSKDFSRNDEVRVGASKRNIKEFITENLPNSTIEEKKCDYCVELENLGLMKDRCFICGYQFVNWIEHYRKYGNCCELCDKRCQLVNEKDIIKRERMKEYLHNYYITNKNK